MRGPSKPNPAPAGKRRRDRMIQARVTAEMKARVAEAAAAAMLDESDVVRRAVAVFLQAAQEPRQW